MTGELSKSFHGVGIGTFSKILTATLTDLVYFAIRNSEMPGLVQQLLPKFLQLGAFHGNLDSVMAVFGSAKDDFIPSKNAFNFSTVHVLLSKFYLNFILILSSFHWIKFG